jgi:hypothetical protein
MNGISKKLQNMIPDFKEGEIYEFELLRLRNAEMDGGRFNKIVPSKVVIPPSCSIFDPDTEENITISLIEQIIPASPNREEKVLLGKADFYKSEGGRKVIYGKEKGKKTLYEYLYLCPWNEANKDKPWHIPPRRNEYKFKFVDRENNKKNLLDKRKKRIKAQNIAFELGSKELQILCDKLSMEKNLSSKFIYDKTWSESELREKLAAFGERNPGLVISKHSEYNMAIERLVRDALERGIIKHDKAKKQVVWGKGGGLIIEVPSKKKAPDVLGAYFMTDEGKDELEAIVAQMKDTEAVAETD